MEKREQVKEFLLNKCVAVFEEIYRESKQMDERAFGKTPETAIIKYCAHCSRILDYMDSEAGETWRLEVDNLTKVSNQCVHEVKPVSGMYSHEAAFWFSSDEELKHAYFIYQFGPRYARGFSYEIAFDVDGKVNLINETLEWVS